MTSTDTPPGLIGRSIGALFAVVVVLSIGTDVVMHATHVFPPMGQPPSHRQMSDAPFLLATAYRVIYQVAGSYLTARLAPGRPMQHALVGGGVGLALSIVGAALTWNKGPEFGPHWYPLALVVLAMPTAWLGGVLHRTWHPERPTI